MPVARTRQPGLRGPDPEPGRPASFEGSSGHVRSLSDLAVGEMRALQAVVLLASAGALGGATAALPTPASESLPQPTPGVLSSVPRAGMLAHRAVVPDAAATAIRLDADVRIPDAGVLNWPVSVPWGDADEHANVTGVSVLLRGIYHSDPRDLAVELWHGGQAVTLIDGARPGARLGTRHFPDESFPSLDDLSRALQAEEASTGRGADLVVTDLSSSGANLALHAPAAQASVAFGAGPERAVDGGTGGYFDGLSVAHTSSQLQGAPEAWWEADIRSGAGAGANASQPGVNATGDKVVGSLRLWGRGLAPDRDEVQVVRMRAAAQVRGGSFRLRLTMGNLTGRTAPISVFAAASTADERLNGPEGERPGESLETALEAATAQALLPGAAPLLGQSAESLLGAVRVQRSAPDGFGAYAWTVTFLTLAGNVPLLEAEEVATLSTGGIVPVQVVERVRGSSSSAYNYASNGGIAQARLAGTLAPAWVMLLPAPMAGVPLHAARAAALWARRITAADLRGPERRAVVLDVPRSRVTSAASLAAREAAEADSDPATVHGGGLVGAIRVQLETPESALALAEVEAYAAPLRSLQTFRSGNNVRGREAPGATLTGPKASLLPDFTAASARLRTFHSLDPMADLWATSSASAAVAASGQRLYGRLGGAWTIVIRDTVRRRAEQVRLSGERDWASGRSSAAAAAATPPPREHGSRPLVLAHGAGALAGWSLNATLSDGSFRVLRADVAFEARFLPSFGRIYEANVSAAASGRGEAAALHQPWSSERSFATGPQLEEDPLTRRPRTRCGPAGQGVGCRAGVGALLTTDERGEARPSQDTRLTWPASDLRYVYSPREGFVGEDSFRVRAWVGGLSSEEQEVRVLVRRCRLVDAASERAGLGPLAP